MFSLLISIIDQDIFDDEASVQESIMEANNRLSRHEDPRLRQIAPRRNWLAKLFNVKPVSMYICFAVSRRRARREITSVLKEWKRYGITGVQVDKERNIVFGKVGAENCKLSHLFRGPGSGTILIYLSRS